MSEPVENLIEVEHLVKYFPVRGGVFMRTVAQVQAVEELHHDAGHALVLDDVEHGHDAGMVDAAGGSRLPVEADLAGLEVGDPGVQHLERDRTIELDLPRAVDLSHAAYAEQPLHHVLVGHQLADVPMILSGIDPCFSCTDRMVALRDGITRDTRSLTWEDVSRMGVQWYKDRGLDLSGIRIPGGHER